jgi:hypothetical protein
MGEPGDKGHLAKRPRIGERTLLACIHCKQRKLKVLFPVFYSITRKPPLCCRGLRLVYLEITEADPVSTSSIV